MNAKKYKRFESGAKRHIGYKASMNPQQMVAQGRKKGMSMKTIVRELTWAANINEHADPVKSARFRAGAKLAERLEKRKNKVR